MTIQLKYFIYIIVAVSVISAAAGRYLTPEKIQIVTKTVEVEKKVEDKKEDTQKHYKKTTVSTKSPDGAVTTTTTLTLDTDNKKHDDTTQTKDTKVESDKTITSRGTPLNLGLMSGIDYTHSLGVSTVVYGAYINRGLIGPITIGAWGLNTGVVGMSLGLSF